MAAPQSFACEFCGAKFASFETAEAHEQQCQQRAAAGASNPMAMQMQMMRSMMGGAVSPGVTSGPMPGSMPGGVLGGMTGGMPGGMPGGMQGGMPGSMPGGMPGGMPSGMPGGMLCGMPQMMAMMAMMKGMSGQADGASAGMPGMPTMGLPGMMRMMGGMALGSPMMGGMSAMQGFGVPASGGGDAKRGGVAGALPSAAASGGENRVYQLAQEIIDKWNLEKKFKVKLVQHLAKQADVEKEAKRLHKELEDADVPPICRTGYLLVAFGEMNEKHTDEDFKAAILGKALPSDEGEKKIKEEDDDERDTCGDFRLGRCARGDRCRFSHGSASKAESFLSIGQGWMNDELQEFATKFKLDESLKARLAASLCNRIDTFKEDIRTLSDVLRSARHPPGMLSLKLREMENGTFQTRGWTPDGQRAPKEERRASRSREKDNKRKREKDRDRSRSRDRRRDKSRSRSRKRKKDKPRSKARSKSPSSSRSKSRSKRRSKS